ncbi:unnamed protein product [Acanthoscelides obtectus]|uniref:Uncharacterized protein n=1 Tax=Acanthoscelides obtectus TaxID=200917 RepID=A0A9P0P5A6_ACAOB|nr:unnamed protein product [Acanthoscelides obtectus]CAK1630662.1 hypothetical protein AOBTE_LOCUS6474 [Acanthoscelides obtectus]
MSNACQLSTTCQLPIIGNYCISSKCLQNNNDTCSKNLANITFPFFHHLYNLQSKNRSYSGLGKKYQHILIQNSGISAYKMQVCLLLTAELMTLMS